jgi:hypothetical protein
MLENLLLAPGTPIVCPHCDKGFSVDQGFAKQALEQIAAASAKNIERLKNEERAAVEHRARENAAEQQLTSRHTVEQLKQQLARQAEAHDVALREALASTDLATQSKVQRLEAQLAQGQTRLAAIDEREAALGAREQKFKMHVQDAAHQAASKLMASEKASFEELLRQKDVEVAEMRNVELALRQDKSRVESRAAALELEVARKLDAGRAQIEATVRMQEQERASLREAEFQKTISDMSAKLGEAQRKAEQGSQQLQGEVLELAIEDGLRRIFPLDKIEEVKKGVRGGDVLQRIHTRAGQSAGVLLWETKRAKEWSPQWLVKLKDDMRQAGAEIGVLVTTSSAVPKEWTAGQVFGLCEGVWVTNWSTALQLAEVLRSGVLDCHKQRLISAGKGEKLEAVYDYLTSPHFGNKLRAVFEAFERMRDELEAEKNQTQQRWARREKHLQSGMSCLLAIGGEIQGLAQQELPELELAPFKLVAQ